MATPTSKATSARPSGPFTPSAGGNAGSPSQSHLGKNITRSPATVRTRAGTLSRNDRSASQQGATPGSTAFRGGSSPAPHMMGTPSMSHGQGSFGFTGTPMSTGMARGGSSGVEPGLDETGMRNDREVVTKSKIREITDMLKDEWGFVSRDGVVLAAERIKMECLWEGAESDNPATLDLAGEGFMVIVTFWNWWVTKVTIEFGENESVSKEITQRANEILLKDLQGWNGEEPGQEYIKLRKFAENLQYLGVVDNWGKTGINCFQAIHGIYHSLRQVEEWWQQQPNLPGNKDRFEMLTRGPGRTQLHANGKLGLIIDFWLHRWMAKRKVKPDTYLTSPTDLEPHLYSMRIRVAALDPSMTIGPIRISKQWFEFLDDIPGADTMTLDASTQFLPVQLRARDVEPTYLPVAEEPSSSMELDGQAPGKPLPQVLFKAWFGPALLIGCNAAQALLQGRLNFYVQAAGIPMGPYMTMVVPELSSRALTDPEAVRGEPLVVDTTFRHPKTKEDVPLRYSLTGVQDTVTATASVVDFPFSHPSELLSVLPIFRMWAYLHGLFRKSFAGADAKSRSHEAGEVKRKKVDPKAVKEKKKHMRDLSAKEYRALVKAGKPLPTDSASEDSDAEPNASAGGDSEQGPGTIEIAMEFPVDNYNRVHLDITIPIGPDDDPIVAFLAVLPGPQVVTRDTSVGEKWAEWMAETLLECEDFGMLTVFARQVKADKKAKKSQGGK